MACNAKLAGMTQVVGYFFRCARVFRLRLNRRRFSIRLGGSAFFWFLRRHWIAQLLLASILCHNRLGRGFISPAHIGGRI